MTIKKACQGSMSEMSYPDKTRREKRGVIKQSSINEPGMLDRSTISF